ncbi:MAG TPA: hypothetical protein VES42_02320 [Pilimelia sp.]|nr:hypothetical protein [Pilimelia sp.]
MRPNASGQNSAGRASGHLPYQPALDGIRALAVAAVLAFHGGVAAPPGGGLVRRWIAPWLLPQLARLAVTGPPAA